MKKTFLLTLSLLLTAFLYAQNCDISISVAQNEVDGDNIEISPGQKICIEAGQKDYLLLKNIHGTPSNPVIVSNSNGQVVIDTDHFYGIKIANCSYIKFLGNGAENQHYGFYIKRVANGSGISIDELSTNIELAWCEVSNTLIAGLYAKTDPDCTFESSRDNFIMYSVHIHDNYFHDIGDEGMYIGHSKYQQGVHLDDCDTIIFPHVLRDVKVYNNIVERTGWDGIQVSSSDQDCSIHDNIISNDSYKEFTYQMSGILIGGGSKCDCYNNTIIDGKGDGIDVLGLGDMKIYNNLIVRAGKSFQPGNQSEEKHAIYVGDVVTQPGTWFKFYNNTIVQPKSYGIVYNNNIAAKAYFTNNLIVDPGKKNEGEKGFLNIKVSNSKVELNNYLHLTEVSQAMFKDVNYDNYYLTDASPAVDFGKNLASEGLTFDILNYPRPFNTFYDLGAYEYHGPDGINDFKFNNLLKVELSPIPSNGFIKLKINPLETGFLKYSLVNMQGNNLFSNNLELSAHETVVNEINLQEFSKGVYFIVFEFKNTSFTKRIILY